MSRTYVVAPAGGVDVGRLRAGLDRLAGHGVEATLDPEVGRTTWVTAGDDVARARAFERAWLVPATASVLCAEGGYGCTAMLRHVRWPRLRAAAPKTVHGSSDVTALLLAVQVETAARTVFAPMPVDVGKGLVDDAGVADLARSLLAGRAPAEDLVRWAPGDLAPVLAGRGEGTLVGGTLSILAATCGTRWSRPAVGPLVLALEDVGEASYRVDRYLVQLEEAGWAEAVTGVLLGDWVDCSPDTPEVLHRRLATWGVPVVAGGGFGHGRRQRSLPLGARAVVDTAAPVPVVVG